MKIAIVLNFNNYKNTIYCVNNLIKSGIDKTIIVDNASINNSYSKLKKKFMKEMKVDIIYSDVNNGYSSGNNIGLKFAERTYGLDNYIYIVNPDTIVNKEIINGVFLLAKKKSDAGMITTKVNNTMNSVWRHTNLLLGFIFNLWIVNIVLYKFGIIERRIYKKEKNKFQKVEVVSGAFFGIDQNKFKKVGYFDEGTFLYYEEEILFCKLRDVGLNNYIINDLSYRHFGQSSTDIPKLNSKNINDQSRLYFLTKYNNAGVVYIFFYRLINIIDNYFFKFYSKIKRHT